MARHWKTLLFQNKAYVSNIMIAYLNLYQLSKDKKCMSDRSHNRKSALFRMPRNDATARDCNISNMQVKQIVVLKYMLCNEAVYQKQ